MKGKSRKMSGSFKMTRSVQRRLKKSTKPTNLNQMKKVFAH